MTRFSTVLVLGVLWMPFSPVKAEVNATWMKTTLQNHFSKPRHHVTNPGYKAQTMGFIRDTFKSYGLETYSDVFPTRLVNVHGTNVIGILKGINFNTAQDKVVGIGAHYDTMRNTSGVDDNGAAVAAMLQAAKNIATQPNRTCTVVFAAFDFEEWENANVVPKVACAQLACGSEKMITWATRFWKNTPQIQGIVVMDTIMNFNQTPNTQQIPGSQTIFQKLFPVAAKNIANEGLKGNFLAAIGRMFDSTLLDTFVSAFKAESQPKYEVEELKITTLTGPTVTSQEFYKYQNLMRSDHYTFWKNGMPAIFLTDTAEFRGYMKQCYHNPCDKMEHVTNDMINFAAKTSRALIRTVNKMAPPISGGNICQSAKLRNGLVAAALIMLTYFETV